jgi:hypothetical protein
MGPTGTLTYVCSICSDPSHEICVYCTKDVCHSHRCQRCLRCSDCCECESPVCLDEEPEVVETVAETPADAPVAVPSEIAAMAPDELSPEEFPELPEEPPIV